MFDWAAALTYYSVLSIFPAIVVLVAAVGLVGRSATQPLIENARQLPSGQAREVVINVLRQLEDAGAVAGPLAVVGLLGALRAASAYIGGFIRATNAIYGSLAGVVVFLVWLWISNFAVLLGAKFDAELARGRQIARGTRRRRDHSSLRGTPAPTHE